MSERLGAHVLQFPKGQGPTWRRFPAVLAEGEAGGGEGSGTGEVSGSSSVLAEPGEAARADVPQSERVFRVVYCVGCGWQYGAWWPRGYASYWGDCPECGQRTELRDRYQPERPAPATWREARGPAQQELEL